MAKDSIRDYSATSSDNSDIQSVDISEGCAPSGLNNAIREVMTDLKNVSAGTVALETPVADSFSTDTISEKTSATGVTIDGVLLKDGAIGSIANAVAAHLTSINGGQIGGSRNLIINGNMAVSQRGTSVTSFSSQDYTTADRWKLIGSNFGTWTVTQSTDVPAGQGFANSFKLDCTTADTSIGAADSLRFRQGIEGQNLQHLKKGTSNAESVTFSFWVKTNKTGSYAFELLDQDNSRHICKLYTVDSANTWEKKVFTFAGDTSGVLDNDNAMSFQPQWYLIAGTDSTSGTLATSWASRVAANKAAGHNVNLADSTSNEWYITGVQLEVGEVATPFEHEPFSVTLQKCERYYNRIYDIWCDFAVYANNGRMSRRVDFPTTMRANPSMTRNSVSTTNCDGVASNRTNLHGTHIYANSTGAVGDAFFIINNMEADAEL
tara:strand:- start:422 stop:1726 length:1305 start_codon:yes stop_codon:yes gene_type:complete